MARYYRKKNYGGRKKYGKPFRKKTSKGKFRKGQLIRYVYKGNRRVGAVSYKKRRY